MTLLEKFDSTKDARRKFNSIFGSSLVILLIIWCLEFLYFSMIQMYLNSSFLLENIAGIWLFIFNISISIYLSFKTYFWHYLDKQIMQYHNNIDNGESNKEINIHLAQKILLIIYSIYKIAPILLMLSILIFSFSKKGYLDGAGITLVGIISIYFLFYIGKKVYNNVDKSFFINIKYSGYPMSRGL